MNSNEIVIRTDLENLIDIPPDDYENNLQQELEGLFFDNEIDTPENDDISVTGDDMAILFSDLDEDDEGEEVVNVSEDSDSSDVGEELEDFDRKYVNLTSINVDLSSGVSGVRTLYLNEEEENVILKCDNPKLKQLAVLNRIKIVHLKELYKKIHKFKNEHGMKLHHEAKTSAKESKEIQYMSDTHTWKLGIPYFKDKALFRSPANSDLPKKRANNEFLGNKYHEGRRWSFEEQSILHNSVLASYYKYNVMILEKDIKLIDYKIKNEPDTGKKAKLQEERCNLHNKFVNIGMGVPPLHCDKGIDWYFIANMELKGRHGILECKAFWNIYLHPSINKSDWTLEENNKIKKLVVKQNYDWEAITKALNTNRSSYLVCIHYNTTLCDKFKRERFLPEEDAYLTEVVENVRLGDYIPWGRVAYYFEDRSKNQLYHRYRYFLAPKDVKKGMFTEAEDILLRHLTMRFGKDFSKIADLIPNRTAMQLRNRFNCYLGRLSVTVGNYTAEDDERILNYVKKSGTKSWSRLAREMRRTRSHVRQRYITLKKLMVKFPKLNLEELPRRKLVCLSQEQSKRSENMVICLHKLKKLKGIPTLATVESFLKTMHIESLTRERKWRVRKNFTKETKPRSAIDNKLLEFFKSSCKPQKHKMLDDKALKESSHRTVKLYDLLGGNLEALKMAPIEEQETFMSDREYDTLDTIQQLLKDKEIKIPRPQKNGFSDNIEFAVKNLLPPNVNTVLALRGLIIKFEMYRAANKDIWDTIKMNNDQITVENTTAWRIEQNLSAYDELTQGIIKEERDLFWKRLYALVKWPSLLSHSFPSNLEKQNRDEEEEDLDYKVQIEEQKEPRKVGRPPKQVFQKVLKMVEARRKKYANKHLESNNEIVSVQERQACTDDKRKRGRPISLEKNKHALTYLPKRSLPKSTVAKNVNDDIDDIIDLSIEPPLKRKKKVKQPRAELTAVELEVTVTEPVPQNIIRPSLNLPNTSTVVGSDQINKLTKLSQFEDKIVLNNTQSKVKKDVVKLRKLSPEEIKALRKRLIKIKILPTTIPINTDEVVLNPSTYQVNNSEVQTINTESNPRRSARKTTMNKIDYAEQTESSETATAMTDKLKKLLKYKMKPVLSVEEKHMNTPQIVIKEEDSNDNTNVATDNSANMNKSENAVVPEIKLEYNECVFQQPYKVEMPQIDDDNTSDLSSEDLNFENFDTEFLNDGYSSEDSNCDFAEVLPQTTFRSKKVDNVRATIERLREKLKNKNNTCNDN